MTNYKSKYIKYKNKYLKLKGGAEKPPPSSGLSFGASSASGASLKFIDENPSGLSFDTSDASLKFIDETSKNFSNIIKTKKEREPKNPSRLTFVEEEDPNDYRRMKLIAHEKEISRYTPRTIFGSKMGRPSSIQKEKYAKKLARAVFP